MRTVREEAREISVLAEMEVLVVGAGPAGCAAAICAARAGAQTMLIEQAGDVGGVATTGLMSHWTGQTKGGIYEEILDRSTDYDHVDAREETLRIYINPEKLKTVLLEMLAEVGVKVRLYTFFSETLMDGDKVEGAIVQSKSGRQAILASTIIDSTGDGDVAASAGIPYIKGREDDGKMQPMTLMFKVGGVDTERAVLPGGFEQNKPVPKGLIQTLGEEHMQSPLGHVLLYRSTLPGIVTCNMTNVIDVDGTDPDDLTHATLTARRQMAEILAFIREFVPGFENCYILSSASQIGVRETRHFEGRYELTEDDINVARQFEDQVVPDAHFNFDIHNVEGSGLDADGEQEKFKQTRGYGIPYRCLLPRSVRGLLLSGRNIAGTHKAHSNFRVMPIAANIGQAAGVAAALSVQAGVAPGDLDISVLQEALRKQGVKL